MAHNFSPKGAGRPSNIEGPRRSRNASTQGRGAAQRDQNRGKEEGTVDRPSTRRNAGGRRGRTRPQDAMRFMRKLDRPGNFDPRDSEADATAAASRSSPQRRPSRPARGCAPRRGARRRRRGAVGLRVGRAGRDRELGGAQSAERDACEGEAAVDAAVTAVQAALAAHKKASSAPPVPPPVAAPAPVPPPAAAGSRAQADVRPTRSTALANALDDESTAECPRCNGGSRRWGQGEGEEDVSLPTTEGERGRRREEDSK